MFSALDPHDWVTIGVVGIGFTLYAIGSLIPCKSGTLTSFIEQFTFSDLKAALEGLRKTIWR